MILDLQTIYARFVVDVEKIGLMTEFSFKKVFKIHNFKGYLFIHFHNRTDTEIAFEKSNYFFH